LIHGASGQAQQHLVRLNDRSHGLGMPFSARVCNYAANSDMHTTADRQFDWQFTFNSWHCHSSSKWRQ